MGGETDPIPTPTATAADAAPAPAAPAPKPTLQLKLEAEYAAYARSGGAATAVCHLEAPDESVAAAAVDAAAATAEQERANVDLVAVMDVSGSMSGAKLKLVQTTLAFIIKNLRSTDRLGLVAFDSDVARPLPLCTMDKKGKAQALQAVERLRAGSCTNLSGGLFAGMEMMATRPSATASAAAGGSTSATSWLSGALQSARQMLGGGSGESTSASASESAAAAEAGDEAGSSLGRVGTVMLLTDGMANEGISDEAALTAATRQLLGDSPGYTLYTMGYGSDHQTTLLKALAEVGGGMYYYIENDEAVPPSFADVLGGLLTTVAQNVKVTLTAEAGRCRITGVETTRKTTLAADGSSVEVELGDIQSEESRDLVLRLQLAPLDDEGAAAAAAAAAAAEGLSEADAMLPHLTARVNFVNTLSHQFETVTAALALQRPAAVPAEGLPASELVREQLRRVEVANAIKSAMAQAERGELQQARAVLQQQRVQLDGLDDAYTSALRADLDEISANMVTPTAYRSKGAYACSSAVQSHSMQRSNRAFTEMEEAAGRASYVTSKKAAWRGFSRAAVSKE